MRFFRRHSKSALGEPPSVTALREAALKDPLYQILHNQGEEAAIVAMQENLALLVLDAREQGRSRDERDKLLKWATRYAFILFDEYYRRQGVQAGQASSEAVNQANRIGTGFGEKLRKVSANREFYRQKALVETAEGLDGASVDNLYHQVGHGLNDLVVNRTNGRQYWISTLRFPEAGWQTGVFDRSLPSWLSKPLFRVNEMEVAPGALINHLVAMAMVAEAPPDKWPKAMYWSRPEHPTWLSHLVAIEARLNEKFSSPSQRGDSELKALYSEVRRLYQADHLSEGPDALRGSQ